MSELSMSQFAKAEDYWKARAEAAEARLAEVEATKAGILKRAQTAEQRHRDSRAMNAEHAANAKAGWDKYATTAIRAYMLEEALRFYADEQNWISRHSARYTKLAEVISDNGKRARAALSDTPHKGARDE